MREWGINCEKKLKGFRNGNIAGKRTKFPNYMTEKHVER